MEYEIVITRAADEDLAALSAFDRATILDAIDCMKIIELEHNPPSMKALLEAAQDEDLLLVRAGHPLVRIEKFDDDDLEDWKYEHSAEAIARGEAAREQYRNGKFRSIKQKSETAHLSKASQKIRSLYSRYKEAILRFGERVRVEPVESYIGFWANERRRLAEFHVHEDFIKIWIRVRAGELNDPKRLTNKTQWHTIPRITDERGFEDIISLLKQAYEMNK